LLDFTLAKPGSTGTGTFAGDATGGLERSARVAVTVSPTGGTSMVYTIEGLMPDGSWQALATVKADSTVAASSAAITTNAGTVEVRFVSGLDARFIKGIRLNVSANTATSFGAKAFGLPFADGRGPASSEGAARPLLQRAARAAPSQVPLVPAGRQVQTAHLPDAVPLGGRRRPGPDPVQASRRRTARWQDAERGVGGPVLRAPPGASSIATRTARSLIVRSGSGRWPRTTRSAARRC
jgi:hypothetical protein